MFHAQPHTRLPIVVVWIRCALVLETAKLFLRTRWSLPRTSCWTVRGTWTYPRTCHPPNSTPTTTVTRNTICTPSRHSPTAANVQVCMSSLRVSRSPVLRDFIWIIIVYCLSYPGCILICEEMLCSTFCDAKFHLYNRNHPLILYNNCNTPNAIFIRYLKSCTE